MSFKKRLLSYLKAAPSMPWLTEVEWLQNDYSQANNSAPYIDTEVKASWDLPFELVATVTKTSANRCLVLGNAPNQRTFYIELTASNRLRFSSQDSTGTDPTFVEFNVYTNSSYPIPLNVPTKIWVKYNPRHDSAHTVDYELGLEALDGSVSRTETGSVYRAGQPLSARLNLHMFNDYRTPVSTFDGGFKIHQCEIKMGTVHKKFIPCLDLNRIPCMYEQIEGKLYYNSGTGGFNIGRRITEVEYMNLTGTQYFNTGLKPNTLTTTLKTVIEINPDSLTRFPFGSRPAANYTNSCACYLGGSVSISPYGYLRLDWAVQNGTDRYNFVSSTEKLNIEITGNYAKVNGEEFTSSVVTSYTQTRPFYIGTCATGNSAFQSMFIGKVYYNHLYDPNLGERYCVPAHDENNVGFFFDRVNHFIMDNEGRNTSDMTWGDEIHPVSYLYGGYPDRFDLGIPFYDHLWETDVRYNVSRSAINLMGSTTGACNYWGVLESGSQYGTYSVHTTNADYCLNIDPSETRTVFLETGRNIYNTTDIIGMVVEGENVVRGISEANRTLGYKIPTTNNSSYVGEAYIYGNRCYDRATRELLQNIIPVQNGQKVGKLFDTITHTLISNTSITDGFVKGSDVVGYNTTPQLPYGLIEVDYLESSGEQYIDTGIMMNSDYGVEIEARQTNTTTGVSRFMFGDAITSGSRYMLASSLSSNKYIFDLLSSSYRISSTISGYDGKFHKHKVENAEYYIDGVSQGSLSITAFTGTRTAWLFSSRGTGATTNSYWQIRKCKIFDGSGRIIADYVPCLRIYDNKPGMFDLITRQFLTNQGTGEFIIGIDGVGYTPADYLESTGTQWIDTGIKMQGKYGVEIEAKQTSADTGFGRYLFGDAPASAGRYLIVVTSGGNVFRLGLDTLNRDSNVSGYDGQFHTHKVENKTYFIDGVSQGTLNAPDFTCNRNARLFSVATTSTLSDNTWQIKRCIIKDENNNKLANFVPLVRVSDSKPGMFDLVSRTLCVNGADGTDFTVGTR